jgi:WD40 repeat protein
LEFILQGLIPASRDDHGVTAEERTDLFRIRTRAMRRFIAVMWVVLGMTNTIPAQAEPTPKEPSAPGKRPAATDCYGDPLPEGAIARLGTVRFRLGHTHAVAFSPDGKVLAGTGGFGPCLWDAATGRPLLRLQDHYALSLAFSPDSKSLLLGNSLSLIDVASGKELRRFGGRGLYFGDVVFSADGTMVATGEERRTPSVIIWDVATGKQLCQLQEHTGLVWSLAFSPDSKLLASGSLDKTLRLWNTSTGKEVHRFTGHGGGVLSTAFAPDGKLLASGSEDRTIRLWDVARRKELRRLEGHTGSVNSVAFSPDGQTLASGGGDRASIHAAADGMIRLWAVGTGKELRHWEAHADGVVSVAFSPNGKTLASAGLRDDGVCLWDVATGTRQFPMGGHTGAVDSVTFSPDGQSLISHSRLDRKILEWDLRTSKVRRRLLGGAHSRQWWLPTALSSNGKVLAQVEESSTPSRSETSLVRLWDTSSGKRLHALSTHNHWFQSLTFSPDGNLLASACPDRKIYVWKAATGGALHELDSEARLLAFSPDGRTLGTASYKDIHLWDVATGKELRSWESDQYGFCLLFSSDGKLLAISAADSRRILVWDAATGKEVRRLYCPGINFTLAFSPSGRVLAWDESRQRRVIRLVELASGQEIRRFDGDQGLIHALAFAPDGRTLASGGSDSAILLWDLTGRTRGGRAPARLTSKDADKLWAELAGEASRAYQALGTLAVSAETVLPLFRKRLQPIAPPEPKYVARLIANLDDNDFAVREEASRALEKLDELAAAALREALAGKPSAEVRRRANRLLERLQSFRVPSPEVLRGLRALELLEQMGTPEATELVKTLTQGVPDSRLTQEAKSSLQRLAKRLNRNAPKNGR